MPHEVKPTRPDRPAGPAAVAAFPSHARRVVLDTNVVLALCLFSDPRLFALRQALETGGLCWLATPAMLAELLHEVRPERCLRYGVTADNVLLAIKQLPQQQVSAVQAIAGNRLTLRCTDPKDQMFIDLAIGHRVPYLLSRDRAVLKLRRKAAAWGVTIMQPEFWSVLPSSIHTQQISRP